VNRGVTRAGLGGDLLLVLEVGDVVAQAAGAVSGLGHFCYVGSEPTQVPHADFRFLSRFHYWAADVLTWGDEAPWGEHEVDYILFVQADVTLQPNPDEVDAVRYVTPAELRELLVDKSLRWSPWFVGIMERGGWDYWAELEEALKEGGRFVTNDIVFFDPPDEFKAKYNLESHTKETGVQQLEGAVA